METDRSRSGRGWGVLIAAWGGLCFRPRVQQDSADSCVLTLHGDYPGWCEESSALPRICCSLGSVPPDWLARVTRTEGGSEPPHVPTTARDGGRHGWCPSPRRQAADRNLDPGCFPAIVLRRAPCARFPFSPSGSGALRDVAYFRGLFVLRSGQVRDGSHVSERERERASCSSLGLFLSAPFLPVLPQCSHASSFDDVTAQAREGHGLMPPLRKSRRSKRTERHTRAGPALIFMRAVILAGTWS